MFKVTSEKSVSAREKRVLQFWQTESIFERSVECRKGSPLFSFYDGPPFATGLPHYGHLLAGTIKDAVARYKTMCGFYTPRRFGWDCHGLPVENEIEKTQQLSGAPAIEAFGIERFNEECRKIVLRYTQEWEDTVHRMGRWVSFDNTYRTMDTPFMESVWWVFGQLFERGLIYEGFKVMPFSAKLGTPLSHFEANLHYKEVDDPALTVCFVREGDPNTRFLVWTTTPWTLPANLGLMVGPDIVYVQIEDRQTGTKYILAESRCTAVLQDMGRYVILQKFPGRTMEGWKYVPLFPYFAGRIEHKAFRILLEDTISKEEGTGIVHCAPAFGEVDFYASIRAGIEPVCPVDQNGKFTHEVPEYAGMFVKDADKGIIQHLKNTKHVFHHGQVRHRYPFCWRSDTPLLYKTVKTWFVAVEKIKEKIIRANAQIHWVPAHVKDGRFGKWLENARDWAISRNRYWGTPLPIWRSRGGDVYVVSSIAELEELTGTHIGDLHRHSIDGLRFTIDGREYERVPEVFDCWFESGSMPYAQWHFPFENQENTLNAFPADFIGEGLDQTRGWFYTLTVLGAALFDQPAFKNVIVNGIVLTEDGSKMSKRLRNYPNPDVLLDAYGADAIRLYFLSSNAVMAEDLRFSEQGVEQVRRAVLIPLWNAYVFFATYASIYAWDPVHLCCGEAVEEDIDRWILSKMVGLRHSVAEGMDRYHLGAAASPLVAFVDALTNWYIRRCRHRFWSDQDTKNRRAAFGTLYTVLLDFVKVAAPFIPFLTEEIYLQLRTEGMPVSVHLCDFPSQQSGTRDLCLEAEMEYVQSVVSVAHGLRKTHRLKVRQPLQHAFVVCPDDQVLVALSRQEKLIAEELNVKQIVLQKEESGFVELQAKPNFRVLGKRVGKLMDVARQVIESFDPSRLQILLKGGSLEVRIAGVPFVLTSEDVEIERKALPGLIAATDGNITVALDTSLTDGLLMEGLARELVNKVNTMRRDQGFAVTDRIVLKLKTTEKVRECIHRFRAYIAGEILATDVEFVDCVGTDWDLNGERTTISLQISER